MTWKELKDCLEKKGVKDDDEILYIDVHIDHIGEIKITKHESGALQIE